MHKGQNIYFTSSILITFAFTVFFLPCKLSAQSHEIDRGIVVGAERMDKIIPLTKGKRIGIIGNHTSIVGDRGSLLPEVLIDKGVNVVKLFSPEHGFRGNIDAGKSIASSIDKKTGLPIVSLYGNHKKPTARDLENIDVLLFDLQDVGTRFYTYISTMHYCMEAAAEQGILFIVLDRPNPNDYIDGPILRANCRSFIGIHPIPVLHGLTVGELAQMINGEKWLNSKKKSCQLIVIPVKGWQHGQKYILPVAPSPNLKSDAAIRLYPSLCLFEATILSVGRGTDDPFTMIGYPDKRIGTYTFTPAPQQGATNPKHKKKKCYGVNYKDSISSGGLSIAPFISFYRLTKKLGYELVDRPRTLELLIGNKRFLHEIEKGMSEEDIKNLWKEELRQYRTLRRKYLIYEDRRD